VKYLTLVRHAKSSWKHDGLADIDRPLNSRGKASAPMMGKVLKQKDISFDVVFSSPAKRAYKTAKLICNELSYPQQNIIQHVDLYTASVDSLYSFLQQYGNEHQHIALVGHNPTITEFASELSGKYINNVPTCGIIAIEFSFHHWKDIAPATGKIIYFDVPRNYVE